MNNLFEKKKKIFSWLFLLFFMSANANTYSQEILLSGSKVSLKEIVAEIQNQSDYRIFVNKSLLDNTYVSFDKRNINVKEMLELLSPKSTISYRIEGNTIFLFKKRKNDDENAYTTTITRNINEQEFVELQGSVSDEYNKPLAGVTVRLIDYPAKSVTDSKGKFSMMVPTDQAYQLEFAFVGMEKVIKSVKGNAPITVTMKPKTNNLDELVVTGYQVLKKQEVVGATSTIKASELPITGFNSLEQLLQGRLAGVVVTNQSGQVGVRQKTRIRGTSTLVGNADPVWVVDGVIQEDPLPFKPESIDLSGQALQDNFDFIRNYIGNSIAWLNPMDIEDVTILKDAVATAIYGIRAANGVIVITTKKGDGVSSVGYNFGINLSDRVDSKRLDMMNSKDRVAVSREIFERGLVSPTSYNGGIGYAGLLSQYLNKQLTNEEFNQGVKRLEVQNTDWFDVLFRAPFSMNHNLNISGGNEKFRVYSSFGYNDTKGTAIGNGSNGVTGTVNANLVLSPKLNLSARVSGAHNKVNGFFQVDPYKYASSMNRVIPAYDEAGLPYFYNGPSGYRYNFLNERAHTGNVNRTAQINSMVNVNYDIIKGLRFNTLLSYGVSSALGETYATEQTEFIAKEYRGYDYGTVKPNSPAYIASRLPAGGVFSSADMQSSVINWRNSLNYTKTLREKHSMVFLFGQELSSTVQNGFNSSQLGYLHDRGKSFANIPITITSGATSLPNDLNQRMPRSIIDRKINTLGIYFTGSYSYDQRYAVNFSIRSDMSNRFGQFTNKRFNPVWAGGARWNISEERWFHDVSWMTQLSLRGSYGYQRNIASNVGPDLILKIPSGTTASGVDVFTGENILEILTLPYADLRWEKNESTNLGVDLSLFENRISMTLDFYQKKGRDLLSTLDIPLEYGMTNMIVNGGSMNNKGFELALSFMPIRKKDYSLTVGFNTAKNFNKITRTGLLNRHWSEATGGNYYKEGFPVSGFWAFDFQGIDRNTGYPIIDLETTEEGDPTVDPTTFMKYVGKRDPDLTGGLNLNFRYKQVSVSTSMYLQLGGKQFLSPAYSMIMRLPTEYENLSNEMLSRWTPTNKDAGFPGLPDNRVPSFLLPNGRTNSNVYEMYNYSTARVVNGSLLRMNTLAINYFVPSTLTKKVGAKNANLSFVVNNPFSWVSSDFKGRDPEVAQGAQPRMRAYSVNVGVTF